MGQTTGRDVSPEIKDDAEVLNDIIFVCRDGEKLYRHVADRVADQQLRNMFAEMASVRLEIVRELESEVVLRGVEPQRTGSVAAKISRWYLDALSQFTNFADKLFIDELVETEDRTLKILRSAVQEVEDRSLMFRLSSLVATFQISHDRMLTVQNLCK